MCIRDSVYAEQNFGDLIGLSKKIMLVNEVEW